MNDGIENKSSGRPFKMEQWVNQLVKILDDEDVLFLSDKDLVFLVNQDLPQEHKISASTFEKWKAGKFAPSEEIGKEFINCITLALIRQKQLLSKKMMADVTGQWTRYAWIMERKFSDWNLKHISENINRNEHETVINITAGNAEQKELIDSIINAEFEEVRPIQIKQTNVEQHNEKEDELPF